MSVATVKAALASYQATIPGVVSAYAQAPNSVSAADMPMFTNFTGASDEDWNTGGADEGVEIRQYRMILLLLPRGSGVAGEAERIAEPFFPMVRDFFDARPHLGTPGVQSSIFQGDGGLVIINYGGLDYYAIEFKLMVTEYFPRTYAVGE